MPSKNVKMKKKHNENIVEIKQHRHPVMWGGSIAILVLVVVTFIGAPLVRGLLKSGGEIIFGEYDGEDISYSGTNYFSRQLDNFVQKYQDTNKNNTNYQAQNYQIWKSAFDATVYHIAILQSAKRSGLHISEHRIDKALTQYGPYMENGKFSPELYKSATNSSRYSTRKLYREELIQQQYLSDIQSRISSSGEKKFIKAMSSPERNFEFVVFNFTGYPKEKVISYGKKNKKLFSQISINRISLKNDKKAAQTIYTQLKNNPSRFEELAQNQSTDIYADKGGDMGWVNYYSLKSDFSDQKDLNEVFSLKPGEMSKLIKTPYGFSIYRCNKAATNPDFASNDVIKQIRNYLLTTEKGIIEDYFVSRAQEFIKEAKISGFEKAGKSNNLGYHLTDYFPINYGNSYFLKQIKTIDGNKELDSISTDTRDLEIFFKIKKNEITEPVILNNSVVVAKMINERSVNPKELSFIDTYFTYLVKQFRQQALYKMILSSDKLKNNFLPVFSKTILKRYK